ncbi:unnamed protein product [Linum tenue]|uniref:non-specific serine/threonine protein kinase n=1 Tax=Linum tenue TaxID=586396 RepID=A0AAV0PGQ4_9ROSI|nr:unnamed protein product [Linum tenue]
MEMPGRRSNYSLLSQYPDEQLSAGTPPPPYYDSFSSDSKSSRIKSDRDRGFDWEAGGDHRLNQPANNNNNNNSSNGISNRGNLNLYSSIGLQRQSSGSSFGESSLSGEYYAATLSTGGGNEIEPYGYMTRGMDAAGMGPGSSGKSWAQQTEESYQLQLALALRLSSEATCADDPNFLDPVPDESASRSSSSNSAETLSHRFWVNGCLSYFDKIPDGFYLISGMEPYVWSVCTDYQENGRIPSIETLKSADPTADTSLEVVLIDRRSDPTLKEFQTRVHNISCNSITTKEVVNQLANLVCNRMGRCCFVEYSVNQAFIATRGSSTTGEDELFSIWMECNDDLKDRLGSIVVPIGSLSIGLCRHRTLLFKVLADAIDLPCRIAKGCKYCKRDDASSCLVRFGLDREYLVDLVGKPGLLCEPDSSLNGPSSISISSPLRFPQTKSAEHAIDFRSLAKQYFTDCQSLNIVFDDTSAAGIITTAEEDHKFPNNNEASQPLLPPRVTRTGGQDRSLQPPKVYNPAQSKQPSMMLKDTSIKHVLATGQNLLSVASSDARFSEGSQLISGRPSKDLSLEVEEFDIPWTDLVLKERIGAGSFGTVHRADWHGSDVAVKILMEQEFHAERFKEFLREVAIMKRLRHPNIVLFMGAVTKPPNLSIVTEYLSRGSLYRLLHKSGAREALDERRRWNMAYDVAKGMNYLHKRNPPIVHRDLKSPNLLVDKKYTVKVCDFGLSRLKANTFLSSKSAAGTPEWMAPEVLRDEPSNEKSDVYSFGIILWELATMQQPWGNLNPAQVVAAVGFKCKRLEIPREVNPQVANIIEACWANEPWKRPSFANIMESLRPLIKPPTNPQAGRPDMALLP